VAEAHAWRIPEHYDSTWTPDLELHRDQPGHPFKPFGATIGHGFEWSRLMVHLEAAIGADGAWLVDAAERLFHRAVDDGWSVDGAPGFVYTTDWSGRPVVRDRMHWVAAEAIGAAAALLRRTGHSDYALWYQRWWDYADTHLIDHVRGSWRHQLDAANRLTSSVWEGKPDLYHAVQATLIPRLPLYPMLATAIARGRVD
jgi:mannose/cellobiose epimerase-like protein (N-acyl-D-glucosamine 2-epimerase family)